MSKTDLQKSIIRTAHRNPNATQREIADVVGCSTSYVSQTINDFRREDLPFSPYEIQPGFSVEQFSWIDDGHEAEPLMTPEQREQFELTLREGFAVLGHWGRALVRKVR